MRKMQSGFTLIELIMVIVILGALAVIALPRYVDLATQAEVASANGVLGAAQSAAAINFAAGLANVTGHAPITTGAELLAALNPAPSGWAAAGQDIGWDSDNDATTGDANGFEYAITVTAEVTDTTPADLAASW